MQHESMHSESGLAGLSDVELSAIADADLGDGGLGYDPVQQLCNEIGIPQGLPCNCETISSIAGPCSDVTRRTCTDRFARSVQQGICCPAGGYVGEDCPHPSPTTGTGGAYQAGFMSGPMPWILGSAVAGTLMIAVLNK